MTATVAGAMLLLLIVLVYVVLLRNKQEDMVASFTIWLIFSVVLALAPLIFNTVSTFMTGVDPSMADLIGHGELLIVSVALGADAVGKLIGTGPHYKTPKVVASGACIFLVIISSLLFSVTSQPGSTTGHRGAVLRTA
jgi:hypothetical protein